MITQSGLLIHPARSQGSTHLYLEATYTFEAASEGCVAAAALRRRYVGCGTLKYLLRCFSVFAKPSPLSRFYVNTV